MTRARFDYFRVTLKPEHELPNERDQYGKTPFEHCMSTLKNTLLLGDLIKKMVDCGRCLHYDRRFSYENISLKVPTEEHYSIQGVCLEFSAQGLDYFNGYLDDLGISFKCWCGMLRALCFRGYQIAVTRFDYAMDGITKSVEETQISLKRVIWAIRDGEMCCKARVWSDQGDDFRRLFSYKKNRKRVNGDELEGLTVQLGSRQSDTICRFYDKKTEQIQKGKELPEGCSAWTRCEFEFKNSNAMCVFNAFIDSNDDEQFSEYMCGSALNFVRFVERTSDNVSRCATKRWWKAFLNDATKKVEFHKVKLAKSAFVRFSRGFRKQWLSSIYTVIDTWGMEYFADWLEKSVNDEISKGRVMVKEELQQNLRDGKRYYEEQTGFKRFDYTSDLSSEELRENISHQHFDYYQQYYMIVRKPKRVDHQGVLCSDV